MRPAFKKWGLTLLMVIMVLVSALAWLRLNKEEAAAPLFDLPLFIAHAGGGINGLTYLNSLQVLNHNYQLGHRFFEVDFSWTADDEMVLIHDWGYSYGYLFNNDSKQPPYLSDFLKMDMNFDQTQLSLDQFAEWMKQHPDAIVITDIKKHNIKGLQTMMASIDNPYQRIIPQVYHPRNYHKIRRLGFHDIVFAMYMTTRPTDELLNFIRSNRLLAISIKPKRSDFEPIIKEIGSSNTLVYTLFVNDPNQFRQLQSLGVDGAVTDFLYQKGKNILLQH